MLCKCVKLANVFQQNDFIFDNKRRTGCDIDIAKSNYLVVSFHMMRLMNLRIWYPGIHESIH